MISTLGKTELPRDVAMTGMGQTPSFLVMLGKVSFDRKRTLPELPGISEEGCKGHYDSESPSREEHADIDPEPLRVLLACDYLAGLEPSLSKQKLNASNCKEQ